MPTPDKPIAEYNLNSTHLNDFQKQMQFVLTFGIKQRKIWWKASFSNEKIFQCHIITEIIGNRNKEHDSQVIEKEKATLFYDIFQVVIL